MSRSPHIPTRDQELGFIMALAEGYTVAQSFDEVGLTYTRGNNMWASMRVRYGVHTPAQMVARAYHLGWLVPMVAARG